jgi:hypothetical protein
VGPVWFWIFMGIMLVALLALTIADARRRRR